MAKAPKKGKGSESDPTTEHYKLKTQAVNDLVTADESNSPQVSKAELARYGARKKGGFPSWLKVAFIKWWFPGSVFFFIIMGIPGMTEGYLENAILILGVVLGMVTDLLTDNMVRFISPTDGEYDSFLMFPKKRYITFVLNILYSIVLCALVFYGVYTGVNAIIDAVTQRPADLRLVADASETSLVPGGAGFALIPEPIGFGLFYMGWDMLLLGVKHLIKKAIHGSKNKNEQEG